MSGNLKATLALARGSREVVTIRPEADTQPVPETSLPGPKPVKAERVKVGKSSNPDYRKINPYVRRDWMQMIEMHLLKAGSKQDLSDFFEELLEPAIRRLGD